jgi:hypothetical protein
VVGDLVVGALFNQGFFRTLMLLAVAFLWAFALFDLVRRPMSGVGKAVWIVVIIVLPAIGALIYILTRTDTSFSSPGAAVDPRSPQDEMTRFYRG